MQFWLTGGELTEAIRRKPFAVVLLDEMEKAHRGWFKNVINGFKLIPLLYLFI